MSICGSPARPFIATICSHNAAFYRGLANPFHGAFGGGMAVPDVGRSKPDPVARVPPRRELFWWRRRRGWR
jgi:hypothetical protein